MADAILRRLKAPTALREQVVMLIAQHMTPLTPDRKLLRRRLSALGNETLHQLLQLQDADWGGKGTGEIRENGDFSEIRRILSEIEEGTLIGYKYFDLTGTARIGALVRTGDVSPEAELVIKTELNGAPIGKIALPDSKEWTLSYADIEPVSGAHPVYFEYHGKGDIEIKEIYLG